MREREPEFTKVAGLLHDFDREKFGLLENLKEITFSAIAQVLGMMEKIQRYRRNWKNKCKIF